MTKLTEADLVWNRACLNSVAALLPGDRALEAIVAFHSATMNGGVLHAVEVFGSERLNDVEAGYRFFGVGDVADLLKQLKTASKSGVELESWEAGFDRLYESIIPDDGALFARFEMMFLRDRDEFSPI